MFYVLDSSDADVAIFLLKVALWHPYGTNIVDPDVVTRGNVAGVGRLNEVVVVTLLFLFASLSDYLDRLLPSLLLFDLLALYLLLYDVLFFLLIVGTFPGVLVVARVRLFEYVCIDVDGGSLHGSSFDVAERAR